MNYTNNSVLTITDIGTGSAALRCTTTYTPCCYSGPPPGTHWYFPNGSQVDRFNTLPYYRSRTDYWFSHPGTVLLHRNPEGTTTGVFRCEIRDDTGAFQSLYVGIYDAYTGESMQYIEEQLVCRARTHGHERNDSTITRGEHEQMLVQNTKQQPFFPNLEVEVDTKFNNETSPAAVSSPLFSPQL